MYQLRNSLYIGFSVAILQESGIFPEVIERFHKSVIGLAKTSAPSDVKNIKTSDIIKRPDRLSKPATLDTLLFFKIVKTVFSETVARLKESF